MNYLLLSSFVIVYLIITGILAYLGYKNTKTSTDYLLAGRRVHPAVMALSYGARSSPPRQSSASAALRRCTEWASCG